MGTGRPRTSSASGRHDYSAEESLTFWQQRWKAEFEALSEPQQRERVAHIRQRLRGAPRRSQLRQLAAACGITEGGDGDDNKHRDE